ncbi:nuclear transport factor 2 family protein [Actinomadura craniellae]|uniref:nuclear transport factor 2 family protein n=1 Tax=Actinomadura craniellae TaxID=2231787 RepID=UPI001F1C2B01|nr:nuclear transport factor 2 family protein [Actinomadura craniellae]
MSVQTENPPFATLYAELQQFYARHMHLLDTGAAEEWAETFTEDGTFLSPSLTEPVRGRTAIAAGVRESAARLAEAGETHRHVLTTVDVTPRPDGSLFARSYTQVIATPHGGQARLHLMCVCEDVLVLAGDGFRVRERRVTRDDMP